MTVIEIPGLDGADFLSPTDSSSSSSLPLFFSPSEVSSSSSFSSSILRISFYKSNIVWIKYFISNNQLLDKLPPSMVSFQSQRNSACVLILVDKYNQLWIHRIIQQCRPLIQLLQQTKRTFPILVNRIPSAIGYLLPIKHLTIINYWWLIESTVSISIYLQVMWEFEE